MEKTHPDEGTLVAPVSTCTNHLPTDEHEGENSDYELVAHFVRRSNRYIRDGNRLHHAAEQLQFASRHANDDDAITNAKRLTVNDAAVS